MLLVELVFETSCLRDYWAGELAFVSCASIKMSMIHFFNDITFFSNNIFYIFSHYHMGRAHFSQL